jgi:hypothetical protein
MALEDELEIEVLLCCDMWDKADIHTAAIRDSLDRDGAVETVRRYGASRKIEGYQEGLKRALQEFGPEHTMEGLITGDRFRELFDEAEIATAKSKLRDPD